MRVVSLVSGASNTWAVGLQLSQHSCWHPTGGLYLLLAWWATWSCNVFPTSDCIKFNLKLNLYFEIKFYNFDRSATIVTWVVHQHRCLCLQYDTVQIFNISSTTESSLGQHRSRGHGFPGPPCLRTEHQWQVWGIRHVSGHLQQLRSLLGIQGNLCKFCPFLRVIAGSSVPS